MSLLVVLVLCNLLVPLAMPEVDSAISQPLTGPAGVPDVRRNKKDIMGPLVDRTQFRAVLKEVVNCVRQHLNAPGLKLLTPEQVMFWFQNVTLEDLQIVIKEIDAEKDGK
jgi:hypothetical protein